MSGPSPEARAAGLALRSARAEILRDLAAGTLGLAALLTDEACAAQRATLAVVPVERVLRGVTGVGPYTIKRVCLAADVDRHLHLGRLSPGRRQRLVDAVEREADLTRYGGRGPRRRAS